MTAKTSREQGVRSTARAGPEEALRKSELRYRRLFETAQDGILILDAETGAIADVNPFLLDLLGYPFDDMIGKHLWEIGEFKDIAASKAAFATLQSKEYVRYENLPLQTRNGEQRQVEFVSNIYDVEGDKVIQCNIREISARTKMELEAKSHLLDLEIARKAKDSVLAVVSHELRTPLTAISLTLDLLDLGHDLVTATGQSQEPMEFDGPALGHIRHNVQFLSRLTNQLFDFTHVSRGTVHLDREVIDSHQAILEVLEQFERQRESKQISLDLQLHAFDFHLHADAPKFFQIVSSLIDNALKFTPAGGRIDVATHNPYPDRMVILIRDNGIGVETKDIARVFLPFEQADASIHPQYGGLGLGLSTAKSLVEAHEGRLTMESAGKNRGATLTLDFKTTRAARPTGPTNNPVASPRTLHLRILVVEDHAETRTSLTRLLQARGHLVRSADSARAALDISNRNVFDLLITDVGLPDGNGWHLLKTLRLRQSHIQAIALSSYGMPQDLLKSKEAGFSEYLVKPIDFHKLDAAISRSLIAQDSIPVGDPAASNGVSETTLPHEPAP